jgi:enediyne biosynthesis protein E4
MKAMIVRLNLFLLILLLLVVSCGKKQEKEYQFEILSDQQTNLDFRNTLVQTKELNIMHYLYFFNGGGVAAGDFNNDGQVDLFFTSNLDSSRIYLNKGNFQFVETTAKSNITPAKSWTTGVSVVDINNDGMLDIYICQVSGFMNFKGRNHLYVCKRITAGVPYYEEEAGKYGLDFAGLSTQGMFFDYDLDGDLDMYLLNHSVHENGTFGERSDFVGKMHPTAGDRLYRNDNSYFTDVTMGAGINSMVIGYGLGVVAGDVNNDGWPDIYVGNDFHETDYLYINQKNGTFKEQLQEQMTHTSRFSMGVDMGDINNDAYNDIISLDMMPYDPFILKSSQGEDDITTFNFKLTYGYGVQFARNALQLNNGDNTFSEIGRLARVFNTDWSWASLFADINNDGYKDLFITNGIPARMNDIDYVNFRADNEDHRFRTSVHRSDAGDLEIIKNIPEIRIPNKFFINSGALVFEEMRDQIRNDKPGFSNGAISADLDNDGDIDFVTNNINDKASVYKNLQVENRKTGGDFLKFRLQGTEQNRNAIGARVIIFRGHEKIVAENFTVRGFQSSLPSELHIGVGDSSSVDSVYVIWPDHRFSKLTNPRYNSRNELSIQGAQGNFDFGKIRHPVELPFQDVTATTSLNYRHRENSFIQFDRERLIPFMVSSEGPGVAVGDVNGDKRDDLFFTGAKMQRGRLFLQDENGKFQEATFPALKKDTLFEDVDAMFLDIDNDHDQDLVLASGGDEFWGESEYLKQRFYLNDGKGNFSDKNFLPTPYMNASCVVAHDFDKDGLTDLFFGGRVVPMAYGQVPNSCLLKNLGNGNFEDVTDQVAPGLRNVGMVTDAQWADLDLDGNADLVLAVEWDVLKVVTFNKGTFTINRIGQEKGWWHLVLPVDGDGDGDLDLIAGNAGMNTRFTPSKKEPLKLYVNDFDKNEQIEQVLTYYVDHREIPFATHAEITKQLPGLKKKFLYAKDFAKAKLTDIFDAAELENSIYYEADFLGNAYYENLGRGKGFVLKALPIAFQYSALRAGIDLGGRPGAAKILLAGNFNDYNIEMGYANADYANILSFRNGEMKIDGNSLGIRGQVRNIVPVTIGKVPCILVARNNDTAIVLRARDK